MNLVFLVRALALKENDNRKLSRYRDFLELYESDWSIYANNARDESENANAPERLPLEEDINLFFGHILKEIDPCVDNRCVFNKLPPT